MEIVKNKDDFIAAMGGAATPAGAATVQDLADAMEAILDHLTRPGMRVYRRQQNRDKFWTDITNAIE